MKHGVQILAMFGFAKPEHMILLFRPKPIASDLKRRIDDQY